MTQLLTAAIPGLTPPPEHAQFARLVGSWIVDAEFFETGGPSTRTTAEWHFASILGGRALQDVLVFPTLDGARLAPSHRIGTSVRFYDTASALWKVVWISPQAGTMYKLSGRLETDRIVLHGDPNDGEPTQWIFEEMTHASFTWRGLVDAGDGWNLIQLMHGTRLDAKR